MANNYLLLLFIITQVINFFILDTFRSLSKLLKIFTGHTDFFNNGAFIYSGSHDETIRVWNVETNKQIKLFNGHSHWPYHYHNHHQNIICSSSSDTTILFWDIKGNQQFQIFNRHTYAIFGIEFSPFNDYVWCVDFIQLQGDNNKDNNSIDVVGGNGYSIFSGSCDKIILFNEHTKCANTVEYSPFVKGLYLTKENDQGYYGIFCLKFLQLKKKSKSDYSNCDIIMCYGLYNSPIRIWGNIKMFVFHILKLIDRFSSRNSVLMFIFFVLLFCYSCSLCGIVDMHKYNQQTERRGIIQEE
ncbi:G-protein beta WD-40 repeats containing protein [Reticulomyxa filosa]|uniref:G-protein beta WD-40 repeats containing protein n=1 Tax=Reticulomyxa filosa TaxID=46433 RepID=X6LSV0_RETFI|nr:G-protein beta WD-40 repeats containing protein [Reticulomyxa filosa]|eukprot:ETO04983.1 G-protein beta WD-40 repeats containing protein [Reticulomyxa filosa]